MKKSLCTAATSKHMHLEKKNRRELLGELLTNSRKKERRKGRQVKP